MVAPNKVILSALQTGQHTDVDTSVKAFLSRPENSAYGDMDKIFANIGKDFGNPQVKYKRTEDGDNTEAIACYAALLEYIQTETLIFGFQYSRK